MGLTGTCDWKTILDVSSECEAKADAGADQIPTRPRVVNLREQSTSAGIRPATQSFGLVAVQQSGRVGDRLERSPMFRSRRSPRYRLA